MNPISLRVLFACLLMLIFVDLFALNTNDCVAPAWNISTAYAEPGIVVAHNGHQWENKWWTQGDEPGTTGQYGVWLDLGVCTDNGGEDSENDNEEENTGDCTAPSWEALTVYAEPGTVVALAGHQWENKWWTQGDEPGTTGQYGVWKDLGACSENGNDNEDPVKQDQTISFPPILDKLTTDAPSVLVASASSGLPITFSVLFGPAYLSGNTIVLTGEEGIVVVLASQAGNDQFNAASPVENTFSVSAPEDTGEENSDCDAPAWNATAVYAQAGTIVSHQSREWENKWWTQGDEPGTTGEFGVWLDKGPCAVGGNQLPELHLISPLGALNQNELIPITLTATATDVDGSISNVTFSIAGQSLTGTNTQGNSYSATWTPTAFGTYTLEVTATDDEGGTTQISQTFQLNQLNEADLDFIITRNEYEQLFPYRYGVDIATGVIDPANDFFSYDALVEAVNRMKNIQVILERRRNSNYYRVTRVDKASGQQVVIREDLAFQSSPNPIITKVVDYGSFTNEGDFDTRRQEIAAFLANISQETTGGWDTAPGGRYAWGLHFREEVGFENCPTCISYRDEGNVNYPPAPGKSYHGRGPIQLSWNYNYGQVSEFLFGDKNILLNNPEMILQDGALAFQTAIWFWMTEQNPKPSAHDVMVGNWTPSCFDIAKGRSAGLGMTVNIINGGLECGGVTENPKVVHRIGHYQRHSGILGSQLDVGGGNTCSECGCANQQSFGGFEGEPEDCDTGARIFNTSLANSASFLQMEIFPNPAKELINVQFNLVDAGKVEILLFDGNGKQVSTLKNGLTDKGQHIIQTNIGNLPDGLFFLQLIYPTGQESIRFVKTNN